MAWPIDDGSDDGWPHFGPRAGLTRPARERLALERRIALSLGFRCFADYYSDRRARGWGLNRLSRETGQTRDWVRGAMRRYGPVDQAPIQAAG
ncbi:MAG: hypothetical protein M3024_01515 [Candidatus Dormibacteraeota bacterium]|nr:hypothetical protein [Candidatus Dormibacteraeota bacterium]